MKAKLLCVLVSMIFVMSAFAGFAPIVNFSFENPAQGENGYTYNGFNPGGFPFSDGAWKVTAGTMWGGVNNWQWSDPNAAQHAFGDLSDNGSTDFVLSQDLPEPALANVRYVLRYYVASTAPGITYNYSGKILIDGVEVTGVSGTSAFYGWTEIAVPGYESVAADAGKTVTISLGFADAVNGDASTAQVTFDYVTLEVVDLGELKSRDPNPADGEQIAGVWPLTWDAPSGEHTYKLFIGDTEQTMVLVYEGSAKTFDAGLEYDTEYVWRVDIVGGLEGSLWTFNTGVPQCDPVLAGDTNGDCSVNLQDFANVANDWLACTSISGPCPE